SRRRHTRFSRDWSSDVCSSDLGAAQPAASRSSLAASMVGDREPITQLIPAARAAAAASTPGAEQDWALDRLEQFHTDGNRLTDEIGRAACRETEETHGDDDPLT